MAVAGQGEARDTDAVDVVAGPERELLEAGDGGQAAPEPVGERPLVLGDGRPSRARPSARQAAPSATTPTTLGEPAS